MSYKQALQENNIDLQSLLDAVNELPDQVSLPTLSNPASPSEILNGYEAIGADGAVIEGTALETASTATAADIMSGKTAYDNLGNLLTGTAAKGYSMKTGSVSISSFGTQSIAQSGIVYGAISLSKSLNAGGVPGNKYTIANNAVTYGSVTVNSSNITISAGQESRTYSYTIFHR